MKINNHPGRLTHFVITLFAALVLQTLCCTPPARAQQLFPGSAIAGREFYVSYLDNNDGATLQLKIVVEKACRITAKYNNLTDSCWNGWNNMLVQPGIYTDSVPYYDMINSQVTEKSSRTITVTSTEDICVYAINYYSARTDASTVLPVPTWGTEYYLATGIPTSSSRGSAYSVTAKEDGTVVTLHNGTTQSLNKNEVYHFYGGGADLTGGKVTATKPVAVFSGSGSSYGPGQGGHYCGNMGNASADHCYEQLWSVDKWGRDFFVWPVKTPQGYGNWGGIMVIVAQEAGTRVTVSGGINGGTDLEYNLNAEGYRYVCYEMSGLTKVTSNKSIMVFTILPDAAITWIPPVQQRIPRAVLSPFILSGNTHITHHAVEMLIPKDWWSQTVIKENGVTVPGNSGYDVTASAYFPDWITVRRELDNTDITIDVTCPGGMLAYMYGYGSAETYGYLAGAAAYDLQCYFTVREKATGLDAYYKNTSAVTHTFEMADNIIVNRAVEKAFTSITWLINGDPYTTVTDNNNMMNTLTFPAAALQGGENTLTMSVRFQDATQDSLYTAHLWLDKLKAFDDYATTAAGMSVKINVRTNDYLPAGCTTPVISVVAPLARHGMATSAGDSVRYVPNSGFTGSDTVTYTISCNGETATAKVYVYVAEMPDNISDAECYVTPPEMDWGMVEDWSSAATSISDHVVPLVGDMNGDGIPEIVVFTTTGRSANGPVSGYARPTLRTIAIYDTRTHLPVRTITIESAVSEYELDTYGMINTPDKGTLIVVPTIDLKLRAYNYAGATAWTSDSPYGQAGEHGAAVGFADFNHDGTPEIYINNRIFNASTGVMLAEAAGGSNRGAAYSCWSTQTSSTPPPAPNWKQSASTAADVLGTGDLQLILGNEIYELEINNPNGFSGNTLTLARTVSPPPGVIDDGHTQVADFNRDGFLDVFISNKTTAVAGYVHGYVWDVHNNTVSSPLVIPAGNNVNGGKSLPLVADFDNDSIPDVLVQTELYGTNKAVFRAFKYNPSSWSFTWMWDFPPVEDSHSTSATLFDFNLDGISEIVLQDQERLRIVNAATGVQHTEFTFGAGTVMQYPIVVDPYGVSGDRSARIVSIGRSGSTGSNLYEGSLNVLKAKSGHWAFARPVWNQIMYNSVNVNDDVSAARYPVNPAVFFPGQDETLNTADDVQPYNAFLKQTEILNKNGTPLWLAPDAAIAAATSAFHYHAGGDSLTVTVEVTNAGDAGLLAPFYLSAYKNTVAAGNKIATDSSLTALNPGAIQSVTLTIDSLSKFLPLDEIIIRVNDRGQATYVQPECDTTSNNAFTVSDLLLAHSDYVSTVSGMTVKIGIKANDSIPNGCAPTPEMLTPLTTPHGSAALMPDDSLRYTATAPGYDTLAYRLTCDGNTSTAYIYIYVAEKPNNITDVECYVPAPSTTWDIERKMVSNAEIHSLATPFAGDLDGDGRIEVVVPNNIGYSPTAQSMLIFDDSLRLIKTITPPATMPEYNTMTNLIADVDGDGKGEIVVATINRTLYCYSLTGETPEPPKWGPTSPYTSVNTDCPSLIIADIDGDGNAEILAADKIYAGESGKLLATLPAGGRGWSDGGPQSFMPVFADVDNDGIQEVVAGNTVYRVTITDRNITSNPVVIVAQMTGFPDGFTSVADIDMDGDLDVIVTGAEASAIAYVWDGATPVQIGNKLTLSGGTRISRAFAGDINGDGRPDIAFTYYCKIAAYSYNPGNNTFVALWTKETTDTSGATTMSMFDFDQNGEVELVYRDEKHLRIIDKDGEDIESIDCTSATHTEYPIVVDLDRDGHADILVSGGTVDYSATRLICYGSKTPGQWASARSVWNQHAYNATNINDDLSIPRYPMNPAMLFSSGRHPYNAFLQQQTALSVDGVPYWATPNVGITATPPVFNYHADGDSLTVAFEIANTGDAGLQAPFYISAYKDEALAANRMDTDSFPTAINQGDTLPVTLTIDSLSKFLPLTDIIIRINDRGQGAYVQPECDTLSNNTLDVPAADLLLAYDDYVSIVTGTSVTIPVLDNDITPAVCPANTLQMDIIGAQSGISTLIGTGNLLNISDLQPGLNTVTYMITCGNSTSTASVYVYVAETPDNISVANCYAPVHQTVWDIERKTVSDREVFWLATPFVGDLDGDGRVEVVAPGNNSTSNASSLLVFDDSLRWIRSITPMDNANFFPNYATMTFLIADVNNDGKGEIVTATTNGNNHALLCFTYEGNELWGGRTVPFGASGQNSLIVADINSDGYAEILAGNSLFDGEKGTLLLTLPAGGRGYNGNNPYASMPVFANMDNDGLQEIVAGNTVYKVTITNRTGTAGNKAEILAQMTGFPDGYTSVADIDLDGDLDVIVTGGGATDNTAILYVWDGATPVQIGQTLSFASSGKSISRAFAGDIDKDGRPDIAFTYVNRIAAYSYNSGNNTFQQLWTNETTDLSGATAMSMFDFDQDGYVELVYRDMKNLRIIDRLGNDIITFPCYSGTHTEYPVVVDLDRDGHADILVSGSETAITIDPPTATGISLIRYGSKTPGQWASARSVWNQHAYNATNINENLRVPRSPMNPATVFPGPDDLNTLDDVRPYNAFLKQQTTLSKDGMPFWPLPDAVFDDTQPVTVTLDGDSVSIILCIANRGSAALGSPVYASLYRDSVKLENLLATDSLAGYIYPGDTACLTVGAGNISSEPFVQLVVRLNDNGKFDGNGDPIYPAQDECDCSDSIRARLSPVLYLMMKKDASIDNVSNRGTYPNPVSVLYSDTIKYTITAVNANLSPTGTLVIRDTLPAYLNYAGDGTRSSSRPPSSFVSNPTVGIPPRDTLTWTFDNVPSMEKVTVTFGATPAGGVSASQPMFVNRAWITASDTIHVPTDSSTYHQGAGVSVVTFSAPAKGGDIYNATPQALDYRTSPRSGILVVPDEGYAFAGWSHDGYTSLRGERIEARTGIMQYDTLTVYGSVELRAVFAPEEYSVRYHLHGGENPEGNPPAYTVESAAVTLVAPSKASDVFTGWTGANGDDPQAEVTIPHGSTGERDYYANYLYSGREDVEAPTSASEDKIWSFEDELYVRTAKAGSTVRVYTPDGILHRLQTVVAAGETRIKLQRGVYIVTINNGAGQKVMIE